MSTQKELTSSDDDRDDNNDYKLAKPGPSKKKSTVPGRYIPLNLPLIKKYNPGYHPNSYSSGDEFEIPKPSPNVTFKRQDYRTPVHSKRKLLQSAALERVEKSGIPHSSQVRRKTPTKPQLSHNDSKPKSSLSPFLSSSIVDKSTTPCSSSLSLSMLDEDNSNCSNLAEHFENTIKFNQNSNEKISTETNSTSTVPENEDSSDDNMCLADIARVEKLYNEPTELPHHALAKSLEEESAKMYPTRIFYNQNRRTKQDRTSTFSEEEFAVKRKRRKQVSSEEENGGNQCEDHSDMSLSQQVKRITEQQLGQPGPSTIAHSSTIENLDEGISNITKNSKITMQQLSSAINQAFITTNSSPNTGSTATENALICSYYDVAVKRSDFETLEPGNFIGDGIIAFCFEYLQNQIFANNTNMLFLSPAVVQHMKIAEHYGDTLTDINAESKDYIFLPINDSMSQEDLGSHWWLFVFSRPENKCYYFDSRHKPLFLSSIYSAYERFKIQFNMESSAFENIDCLIQENLFDCGIHVICNAQNIAEHYNATNTFCAIPKLNRNQITSKRDEIKTIILSISSAVTNQSSNNAVAAVGNLNSKIRKQHEEQASKINNQSSSSPQPSTSTAEKRKMKRNTTTNIHEPKSASVASPPQQKRRKRANKYTRRENKKNQSFTYIKCKLRSIFKEHDGTNTDRIINLINELAMKSTRISFIASLLVLDVIQRRYNQCLATRDYSSFDLTTKEVGIFFYECFKAVTVSSHRTTGHHEYKSPEFDAILNEFRIPLESTARLNNIFRTMFQMYEINFKNNIIVQAKRRLKRLLTLKCVKITGKPQNKTNKRIIDNTINFMFNSRAKCLRNDEVDDILNYIPNKRAIDFNIDDTYVPGFMKKYIKQKWFLFVPTFMKIQREIYHYQCQCRKNSTKIEVGNFNVVPLHSFRMKHIKVDSTSFKYILDALKLAPTKMNTRTGRRVALSINEFREAVDPYDETCNPNWFEHLDWPKIKKIGRNNKKFNYTIVTDGVSVSLEYTRFNEKQPPKTLLEQVEQQAQKYEKFAERYTRNEYDLLVGIDPGYKLFIAALKKYVNGGNEETIQISSKKFYTATNEHIRKNIAKKLTETFEEAARLDRQNTDFYVEYPTPHSPNYIDYIRHRCKFFEQGLAVYTTKKYTKLNFDKYVCTQKAMDNIVNQMTDGTHNGRILMCIGATEFDPSSPIKKYRRCPGTRKIINFIKKKTNCDVVFVDEWGTSQSCGKCHNRFDKHKHKAWQRRGIRHRVCDDCHPVSDIINLPQLIITPKSQRNIQKEKMEMRHIVYQNQPNMSWQDTLNFVGTYFHFLPKHRKQNRYQKVTFDPAVHKQTQKVVWNRDISAARNILIKGIATITKSPIPQSLQRSPNNNQRNYIDQQSETAMDTDTDNHNDSDTN